jgi:hypothetical protein
MRSMPVWLTVALQGQWVLAARPRLGGGGGNVDISVGRIVFALAICVLLSGFIALLLKRAGGRIDLRSARGLLGRRIGDRRIDIIESRRASQHSDVTLIRCDNREYLVLSSERRLLLLRETGASDALSDRP